MRKFGYAFVAVAAVTLMAGAAWAGSASKFAASVEGTSLITSTSTPSSSPAPAILDIPIKTANKSDLLIGVSLESSLITDTKAKGKNGGADSENATAGVDVCVLIDDSAALVLPTCVTFEKRSQTLNTVLGGVISSCEDTGTFNVVAGVCVETGTDVADGIITVQCECVVTDEEIQLILDTTSANHFNFVARNLRSGDHTIKATVTATISKSGSDSTATVAVGAASLTVEEVRAVNDGTGIEFN